MKRGADRYAFWRFSLMVYARPGIAPALLRLQDRAGHNVNLLLFALCLAVRGQALGAGGLARATAAIASLDGKVVRELRRLRRALNGDSDPDIEAMRRRLLVLELAAERRVQARLADIAAAGRKAVARRALLAQANLRLILGADFSTPETAVILQAVADPLPEGAP